MKKAVAMEVVLDAADSWRDHIARDIVPGIMSDTEVIHAQEHCDRLMAAILELSE